MKTITIIGSGLAGCAMGLYLARRGYQVELFEKRDDIRSLPDDFGRSINLALMGRGIKTLKELGLYQDVMNISVPMREREIHKPNGEIVFQPFGRTPEECIYAVPRMPFNRLLVNTLEQLDNVKLYFNHRLNTIDLESELISFTANNKNINYKFNTLIGADGFNSAVRQFLTDNKLADFDTEVLPYGYKELHIPKQLAQNYKHESLLSWPCKDFMLLGNPNIDRSFTLSMFLQTEGKNSFNQIKTDSDVDALFDLHFSDVKDNISNLHHDFFNNPTGKMATTKGGPWHYKDKILLIGDAAHAIIPFFGQGMNSSLEDCRILNSLWDNYSDNYKILFETFYQIRKPNTDAVAQMSYENHLEIRDAVNDPGFHLRRRVELALMQKYPEDFLTKHAMVMFYHAPYELIRDTSELQDRLWKSIKPYCKTPSHINWEGILPHLEQYFEQVKTLKPSYIPRST